MYERIVCLLIPSENTAGDKSLTEGVFGVASLEVIMDFVRGKGGGGGRLANYLSNRVVN